MSTPEFDVHKAVVSASDPVTGMSRVNLPGLMGSSASVMVPPDGLTKSGDLWNVPTVGSAHFVAVSVDGTKVFWISPNTVAVNTVFDYIAFNTSAEHAVTEGQITWNDDEGTVDIGMHGGNVVLQSGQEVLYYVKNQTGSTIANGTVVRFDGSLGSSGRLKAAPFLGDKTYKSDYIMGIATEDIPDGEDGYVTHFGKVRGLDTTEDSEGNALVDGDLLYASATVLGGYTKIEPAAPNNRVLLAAVVHAHAHQGTLFVRPTFVADLLDNERVNAPSITDDDVLVYNGTSGVFENQPFHDVSINTTVTITSHTLAAGDKFSLTQFNNASPVTVTIPTNTFSIGNWFLLQSTGAGGLTLSTSGLTVNSSKVTIDQYESLLVIFTAANTISVVGGTS